jgi:hypothetical protein
MVRTILGQALITSQPNSDYRNPLFLGTRGLIQKNNKYKLFLQLFQTTYFKKNIKNQLQIIIVLAFLISVKNSVIESSIHIIITNILRKILTNAPGALVRETNVVN